MKTSSEILFQAACEILSPDSQTYPPLLNSGNYESLQGINAQPHYIGLMTYLKESFDDLKPEPEFLSFEHEGLVLCPQAKSASKFSREILYDLCGFDKLRLPLREVYRHVMIHLTEFLEACMEYMIFKDTEVLTRWALVKEEFQRNAVRESTFQTFKDAFDQGFYPQKKSAKIEIFIPTALDLFKLSVEWFLKPSPHLDLGSKHDTAYTPVPYLEPPNPVQVLLRTLRIFAEPKKAHSWESYISGMILYLHVKDLVTNDYVEVPKASKYLKLGEKNESL